MTSSTNPAQTPDQTAAAERHALDLSIAKIAGGALAAVTTAVAASWFGVNGTLTGAAFGSVVSSVAAAIYASSLKTAGTKIRTTRTLVRPAVGAPGPDDPVGVPAEVSGTGVQLPGETQVAPFGQAGRPLPPAPRARRALWKPALVLAVSAFVISMGAITLFEGVLGHPIASASGGGTTIGRVANAAPAASSTSRTSSTGTADSTSNSPTDSTSPTDSVSPTDGASPTDSGAASSTGQGTSTGGASPTTAPFGGAVTPSGAVNPTQNPTG